MTSKTTQLISPEKLKYSPSSSSFNILGATYTKYSSGCHRAILLASEGIREFSIPEIYQVLGAHHEEQHLAKLKEKHGSENVLDEVSLRVDTKDFKFSGRIDMIISGNEIHETKGTISKRILRENIKRKTVVPSHLSQAVCYKMFGNYETVVIVLAFYEVNMQGFKKLQEVEFNIDIDHRGFILSNGTWTGYCAHQILEHAQSSAEYYKTNLIPPRPQDYAAKFGSPCHFCPFKDVCNDEKFDSFDEFKTLCKEKL